MLTALLLLACNTETPAEKPAAETPEPEAHAHDDSPAAKLADSASRAFAPLPADMAGGKDLSQARTDLGRMLYYETRISKNHDLSCNSCHQLDNFGVDNEPTSPGHKGARGERNSPTVYNAALHVAQFWDGRAADVEAQAKGPVLNPVEMAMPDDTTVVSVLESIPGYQEPFAKAFPGQDDPITYDNFAIAVGAFERKLVTPGDFDKFLQGDHDALTADEQAGLKLFMETGCASCHAGPALGGQMYMKLGQVEPWETEDKGRGALTGKAADDYFFKVPSLRNIAETGPYLHDGSVESLDEMVKLMAKHQLGKELSDADTASIVTFLKTLTGEVDAEYIAKPELPESGPNTPKPDPT